MLQQAADGPSIPPRRMLKASLLMALYTGAVSGCVCQVGYKLFVPSIFSTWKMVEEAVRQLRFRRPGRGCLDIGSG